MLALQILVRKTYPELPELTIVQPDQVVELYSQRLGALVNEVMIALALNGRHQLLAEIEVARGGRHALVVSIADITLRPSTLAERRLLLSLGVDTIRVPRGMNPYAVARRIRRVVRAQTFQLRSSMYICSASTARRSTSARDGYDGWHPSRSTEIPAATITIRSATDIAQGPRTSTSP